MMLLSCRNPQFGFTSHDFPHLGITSYVNYLSVAVVEHNGQGIDLGQTRPVLAYSSRVGKNLSYGGGEQ